MSDRTFLKGIVAFIKDNPMTESIDLLEAVEISANKDFARRLTEGLQKTIDELTPYYEQTGSAGAYAKVNYAHELIEHIRKLAGLTEKEAKQ